MIEIKTADDLIDRYNDAANDAGWLGWFVVLSISMPYIVFQSEDGDTWATTVPDDEPSERSEPTKRVERLFDRGASVHMLWDGQPPQPVAEASWDDIEPGWRVVVRSIEDEHGRYNERGGIVDQQRYLLDDQGATFIESYQRTGWTLVSAQPPAGNPS